MPWARTFSRISSPPCGGELLPSLRAPRPKPPRDCFCDTHPGQIHDAGPSSTTGPGRAEQQLAWSSYSVGARKCCQTLEHHAACSGTVSSGLCVQQTDGKGRQHRGQLTTLAWLSASVGEAKLNSSAAKESERSSKGCVAPSTRPKRTSQHRRCVLSTNRAVPTRSARGAAVAMMPAHSSESASRYEVRVPCEEQPPGRLLGPLQSGSQLLGMSTDKLLCACCACTSHMCALQQLAAQAASGNRTAQLLFVRCSGQLEGAGEFGLCCGAAPQQLTDPRQPTRPAMDQLAGQNEDRTWEDGDRDMAGQQGPQGTAECYSPEMTKSG